MSSKAKEVRGIEPTYVFGNRYAVFSLKGSKADIEVFKNTVKEVADSGEPRVDICTVVEVIEHVDDPYELVSDVAKLCEYAFFTTPLSDVTKVTRNLEHVKEYSNEDFRKMLSTQFKILKMVYQYGNMEIKSKSEYKGDTFNHNHVVQMAWCRRK